MLAQKKRLPNSPLIIGVTGGVASGKTTVCRMLQALGAEVIDADVIARELTMPGKPAFDEVVRAFGQEVLLPDGQLNRRLLRTMIFRDSAKRRLLEQILHARVLGEILQRVTKISSVYGVIAVPLLTELYADYCWVDEVLVIDVPQSVQLKRLEQRDDIDVVLAHAILSAQASREQRLAIADEVIDNSGTHEELRARCELLHLKWVKLAESRA